MEEDLVIEYIKTHLLSAKTQRNNKKIETVLTKS